MLFACGGEEINFDWHVVESRNGERRWGLRRTRPTPGNLHLFKNGCPTPVNNLSCLCLKRGHTFIREVGIHSDYKHSFCLCPYESYIISKVACSCKHRQSSGAWSCRIPVPDWVQLKLAELLLPCESESHIMGHAGTLQEHQAQVNLSWTNAHWQKTSRCSDLQPSCFSIKVPERKNSTDTNEEHAVHTSCLCRHAIVSFYFI